MQVQARPRTTATFIGLLAPLILWPIYPTLTKFVGNMPPFQLLAIGFAFSFCLSLVIWKTRKQPILNTFRQPLRYWVVGIFGIFGFNCFYLLALTHAPAADAFLMTAIWPLIAILLDAVIFKERLYAYHITGCALSFSGTLCIALNNGMELEGGSHFIGYACAITAAIIWASYSIRIKRDPFPKPEFIGAICGVCAIGFMLLHLLFESTKGISTAQIWPLIGIGLGSLGISYYCWNYGVQYGDIRALSILAFLGHFTTIFLLVLIGVTPLTSTLIAASALIISGAFIGSFGLFKKKN